MIRSQINLPNTALTTSVVPGYRYGGPRFDSRHYQIFSEIVCLDRGPFSLVRISEDLPERKGSGSGLGN
jgi:hypothetical protein